MISKAAEKQEYIKKYTIHAIIPEEKKFPDDNKRIVFDRPRFALSEVELF